jgi:uncharacterized protein
MTADATIDYESLQQEALRGLVRTVLNRVAKSGLPGDHHLYISFDVRAPGVILSKRLREKYPSEMTIVLQHRFWDLAISEERFEVKLTFDGIPERLVVPFNAIKVFLDPSVRYVLHFEEPAASADEGELAAHDGEDAGDGPRPAATKRPRTVRNKPRAEREPGAPASLSAVPPSPVAGLSKPAAIPAAPRPKPAPAPQLAPAPSTSAAEGKPAEPASEKPAGGGAQVVSLDAFRKK